MGNNELGGEPASELTERWLNDVEFDPAQVEAADWLLCLQSSAASDRERAAFVEWLDQDARHVAAFAELFWTSYRAWKMPNAYWADVRRLVEIRYPTAPRFTKRLDVLPRRRIYAVAASVTLAILSCAALVQSALFERDTAASSVVSTTVFDTSVGENRTIVLEDASRLTLGGHTRVEVALSKETRAVTLHQGEAYFEVAKDRARSFTVHAGMADVTAVGTAFNINRSNDGSIVTVTEGTVIVGPVTQRSRGVQLNSGEQVIVTNTSIGNPVVVPDLASVISWQSGRLSFRQRPLREAIADVNRYARKPLVLAPEIGEINVTGTLTINNIGSWVKTLERAFALKATEEADRIIIRPGGLQ